MCNPSGKSREYEALNLYARWEDVLKIYFSSGNAPPRPLRRIAKTKKIDWTKCDSGGIIVAASLRDDHACLWLCYGGEIPELPYLFFLPTFCRPSLKRQLVGGWNDWVASGYPAALQEKPNGVSASGCLIAKPTGNLTLYATRPHQGTYPQQEFCLLESLSKGVLGGHVLCHEEIVSLMFLTQGRGGVLENRCNQRP